jgi:L-aminopeptidase/D-esterase-like protein
MLTYGPDVKGLTDIPGIRVGHASDFDALTGCTAVICDAGAVGGVDIRGSATGTSEIDTLSPGHITERVHGIVFSGGSAFGLEASAGVRRYLAQHGIGFDTGVAKVPIVPSAILFDLALGKAGVRPGREMGEAAAAGASTEAVAEGCVGAGTGATVGKVFGMPRAMKSGIGTFTVELGDGVLVSALVAVNALGNVRDPVSGHPVAGARESADSMEIVDVEKAIRSGQAGGFGRNTTLALVATNAQLTKVQAGKLAALASIGVVRTIAPVNTMWDGDVTFALSAGTLRAGVDALGVAAIQAVEEAILRAVRLARTMGGLPGLAGPLTPR